MPPSLFELRRARKEKAAPQRSDGGTKEEQDDRPMLGVAERRARPKAETFRSSLAGRTGLFASFPSTSYWATFTGSLWDQSSAYNPKLLRLALMGLKPWAEPSCLFGTKYPVPNLMSLWKKYQRRILLRSMKNGREQTKLSGTPLDGAIQVRD